MHKTTLPANYLIYLYSKGQKEKAARLTSEYGDA